MNKDTNDASQQMNTALAQKQGRIHGHTSCGWVGRGGNARIHAFRLVHTNGPTDQQTDGQTDKASHRAACPQLKRLTKMNNREMCLESLISFV